MKDQIKPTDKICFNCKYLAWLIGVGQGLRCGHQTKKEEGKMPPLVPSRFHNGGLFVFKIEPKMSDKIQINNKLQPLTRNKFKRGVSDI